MTRRKRTARISTALPRVEDGAASIIISLRKGRIEVRHGENEALLAYLDRAPYGSWRAIWSLLDSMGFTRTVTKEVR